MNSLIKILLILLIVSFSNTADIDFKEISNLVKTEFNVNEKQEAYFKYKLGDKKGPIGLHFHIANLYTVEVAVYKNIEEEPVLKYFLAQNQFHEFNSSSFEDYAYIIIRETYKYYYKDYLTIYNPNEIIELKSNEPLIINNFLSNNKYEMEFSSEENITLVYNTLNTEKNQRKITIFYEDEKFVEEGVESEYKFEFLPGKISIIVENFVDEESDIENLSQDFSLIVNENKHVLGFNVLTPNEITKTQYIYNDKKQDFYYYVDISNYENSTTVNFKLFFKYYLYNNNTKFYTNIIYLDEEINDTILENNLPTDNKLPFSYDEDSDEYLRIFLKPEKTDKKYKYLLLKVEIMDNEYYVGNKYMEISIGDQLENIELKSIEYNEAYTIDKKLNDYIPIYLKLEFNTNDKYLLTSQYQDLSLFILGDILTEDNKINNNYLTNTNEIIILSGIKELTIKIFGSTSNNVKFYVEKINPSNLMSAENKRNNEIFEIKMTEEECNNDGIKYILGTYDYETYAYGELPVNYYATIDSGEFEVLYKNTIDLEKDSSLFPSQSSQSQEFNKRITLDKNIDLFKVKCKKAGTMYIRPEYKTFSETTHLIEQNSMKEITLFDYSEIVQISTLLGQKEGIVYFSILSLDGEKITISSDTPGLFDDKIIQNNELFASSANLSKYKMDQLAIRVNASSLEKDIEVLEIIHDKYNTYHKVNKGENKNIKLNNIYLEITEKNENISFTFENLENKKISYGVIISPSNDANYLATANKYPNTTLYDIKENKEKISIENIYYNKKDDMKPYIYAVVSILGNEENLDYNVNVEISGESKDDDDDDNNTVLIVFIAIIGAIVLGFIILGLYLIVMKKRFNNNIQNEKEEKLFSQNMNSQVDP